MYLFDKFFFFQFFLRFSKLVKLLQSHAIICTYLTFFPLQGVDPQVLLQHQQQLPPQQGQPLQGQQQQHHEVIPVDGDQQSRFQVSPITEERPANLAFDQKGTMSTQLPGELFSRRGNWGKKESPF